MSTSASYTVSLPLTDYIVGWYGTQLHDPARFLAPGVKAPGILGTYKQYMRQDAFAATDTRRAMYDTARTIDIRGVDIPYKLEEHSLKIGIDDRELLGSVDMEVWRGAMRQAKTRALARRILISHNRDVFDQANRLIPGITSVAGGTDINKWSDSSTPLATILETMVNQFARNNGVYPNRILTTRDIWSKIKANKEIQSLMGEVGRKVLNPEDLLEFIGLKGDDIPEVKVMRTIASYNPGGIDGAEVDNVDIIGNNFYLFYADDNPSMDDISALKTLNLAGDDMFSTVETYRDEDIRTEWTRITANKQIVFAAPSCMMRVNVI